MLSTLLLASTLSFGGFPEVPVGPVSWPVAQQDDVQPVVPLPPAEPPAEFDADAPMPPPAELYPNAPRDLTPRERAERDHTDEDPATQKRLERHQRRPRISDRVPVESIYGPTVSLGLVF